MTRSQLSRNALGSLSCSESLSRGATGDTSGKRRLRYRSPSSAKIRSKGLQVALEPAHVKSFGVGGA
jgi:hypothetical protein